MDAHKSEESLHKKNQTSISNSSRKKIMFPTYSRLQIDRRTDAAK